MKHLLFFTATIFAFFMMQFFVISSVVAQVGLHPIEVETEKCMSEKPTTMGIIECQIKAAGQWNDEMNRTYKQLLSKLPAQDQDNLREQQATWDKLKDLEMAFAEKVYSNKGNSLLTLIASEKTDYVKQRALRLQSYLDILERK
jgi:uncharacterized protein YecT (DUF1311 family)